MQQDNFSAKEALFIQQRYQILNLGRHYKEFSDSYLFCWTNLVYPLLHDDASHGKMPHKLYDDQFYIPSSEVNKALEFLDKKLTNKDPIDFLEVSKHIYSYEEGKAKLSYICRYLYLQKSLSSDFWDDFLRSAGDNLYAFMVSPFDRNKDIRFV